MFQGASGQFAYALLEHYGLEAPPWRSSELWTDTQLSRRGRCSRRSACFSGKEQRGVGACVSVYLGKGCAANLLKAAGIPLVQPLEAFAQRPEYRVRSGAKRLLRHPARKRVRLLFPSLARKVPEQRDRQDHKERSPENRKDSDPAAVVAEVSGGFGVGGGEAHGE